MEESLFVKVTHSDNNNLKRIIWLKPETVKKPYNYD